MLVNHLRFALSLLPYVALLKLQEAPDGTEGTEGDEDTESGTEKRSGASDDSGEEDSFQAPKTEEELNRMIRRRIKRAEEKAAEDAKAKLLAEMEEKDAKEKDDVRKLLEISEGKIAELERKLKEATTGSLREKVAASYKLPAELAEVLRGETEEELKAHAERLAKAAGISTDREEEEEEDTSKRRSVENDLGTQGTRKRNGQKPAAPQFRIQSTVKTVKMPGA